MSKYQLSFWFEHGGFCIWSKNDRAREEYGYAIKNHALPISENLIKEIETLENEYASYLDWNTPQNPSLWTKEHKTDFYLRASSVYEKLRTELGNDFSIINDVSKSLA